MKPNPISNDCVVPRAESVAAVILGLAVIAGPLALGATGHWARFSLESAATAAVALWACANRRSPSRLLFPIAVAVTACLQLAPLPEGILVRLAPVSAGAWKLADAGMPASWPTISIDPAATAAAARRLLLGLATVVCVADLAARLPNKRFLATTLAASGALVILLGIAFPVSFKDRVLLGFIDIKGPIHFWKTPLEPPVRSTGVGEIATLTVERNRFSVDEAIVGDGFGSFLSSNQFANAVCATAPFIAAAVMTRLRTRASALIVWAAVVATFAIGAGMAGFMAKSRAGFAAFLFAGAVFAALVAPRGRARLALAVCATAIAVLLGAITIGLYGPFEPPLGLLPEGLGSSARKLFADPRVVAAHVAFRMFVASPWLGTGLGTYGDIYQRFTKHPYVLYYAHNDYAQLLAESGLVGAAILAGCVWAVGRRFVLFASQRLPTDRFSDAAAWAALAGLGAHAAFDWNTHLPANAFIAAVVAGIAVASRSLKPGFLAQRVDRLISYPCAATMLVIALVASLGLLGRDAVSEQAQRQLRSAITAQRIAMDGREPLAAQPTLDEAISFGSGVARFDPRNAHLAVLIGQAHLLRTKQAQSIDQANSCAEEAEDWFRKAQRNCAACRGLPEPISPRQGREARE